MTSTNPSDEPNVNKRLRDASLSLEDRAAELDTTDYSVLNIGRDNVMLGRARDGHVLNIPWDVLRKRQEMGLIQERTGEAVGYSRLSMKMGSVAAQRPHMS